MKTTFKLLLFATMLSVLTGCDKTPFLPGSDVLPVDFYWLTVSFRDASGNDLVAPLGEERWKPERDHSNWAGEINPDKYKLDIILSNPHETWDNNIYNTRAKDGVIPDVNRPYLSIAKYNEDYKGTLTYKGEELDGYCYLFSNFNIPAINGIQKSLTYKITCPSIFGDNQIHEIVTYWGDDTEVADNAKKGKAIFRYPECKGAMYGGKDVTVTKVEVEASVSRRYYGYFIDIVLDK